MNTSYDVWTDPELAAFVREQPELAAIADALIQTRAGDATRHHRLRPSRLAIGAVAVAAVVVVALVAPWNRSSGTLADRALAAIGSRPVLHVVVDYPIAARQVDIRTGASQPVIMRTEIWYDPGKGRERIEHSIGQRIVSNLFLNLTATAPGRTSLPLLPAALADFITGYTHALATGQAKNDGTGTVDGQPVDWLVFHGPLNTEKVALDPANDKPVLIEFGNSHIRCQSNGTPIRCVGPSSERIESIATIPYIAADFARPTIVGVSGAPFQTDARPKDTLLLDPVTFARGDARADWPGASINGLPLVHAETLSLYAAYAGRPQRTYGGTGLELDYGTGGTGWSQSVNPYVGDSRQYVEIMEARRSRASYAILVPGNLYRIAPTPGKLYESTLGQGGLGGYVGFTSLNGNWVTIQASSQSLLLQAARALRSASP